MGILRFLLAITVVIAHSTPIFGLRFVGGDVAVQTFYIISGFYMGLVLTEKYIGANSSYSLFITNRLFRLYPLYWTVLVVSVLMNCVSYIKYGTTGSIKIPLYSELFNNGLKHFFLGIWLIISNVIIFFQDWCMFFAASNNVAKGIYFCKDFHFEKLPLYKFLFVPQAWTLGVELTFYLIAPFLVRRNNVILIIVILLSIFTRIYLYVNGFKNDPWTYRFFPNELAYFVAGILAYRAYKSIETCRIHIPKLICNLSLPIIMVISIAYQTIDFVGVRYIYPLIVCCLIPFLFKKYKKNKFDNLIGELSYPIYLSHEIVLTIFKKYFPILYDQYNILVLVSIIIFSFILIKFISNPIEHFRHQRTKFKLSR